MTENTLFKIPEKMKAYVIRPENHGEPMKSYQQERINVPEIGPREVLVKVMAAGVNYNGVWAGLGQPASPTVFHKHPFHIAGSDASGIVWKLGSALENTSFPYQVGDEIVIHCGQSCGVCPECNGGNPMLCPDQKIWGYETPYGSFAEFTIAQATQLLPKPPHLNWQEASCYMLVFATAWRMLHGFPPNHVQPGQNVLIWGGSGGLGSMAIQIVKNAGANAIAVVSSKARGEYCMELGAKGYVNRKDFDCWGPLPNIRDRENYKAYLNEVRKLGKAIWAITGKGVNPDIVFEHTGENTFPVSCYLVKRGGMVVYCGATTGFNLSFDAAYGWMHQKRIQGSHFASSRQAYEANRMVVQGKIQPALSQTFSWEELPKAHQMMYENKHPSGNMSVLIQAANGTQMTKENSALKPTSDHS